VNGVAEVKNISIVRVCAWVRVR